LFLKIGSDSFPSFGLSFGLVSKSRSIYKSRNNYAFIQKFASTKWDEVGAIGYLDICAPSQTVIDTTDNTSRHG
jgi:hypothetical protein